MHYAFRFMLAVLAVWRITHLLVNEDGPWNIFARLRRVLSRLALSKLAGCFYCLSLWVALLFAWFVKGDAEEKLVGCLAMSGGAILLERISRERLELRIEEEHSWDVAAKRHRAG